MEDFLKTLAELTALNTGTSSVVAVKTVFTSNEPPAFVAQALIKGMPSGWKLQRLDEPPPDTWPFAAAALNRDALHPHNCR